MSVRAQPNLQEASDALALWYHFHVLKDGTQVHLHTKHGPVVAHESMIVLLLFCCLESFCSGGQVYHSPRGLLDRQAL